MKSILAILGALAAIHYALVQGAKEVAIPPWIPQTLWVVCIALPMCCAGVWFVVQVLRGKIKG